MKNFVKKEMFTLLLILLSLGATAQEERVYIQECTLTPGGDMDYFTIALENGIYEDYTAYQFDLYLPTGLELAYYDGEAEIYLSETDDVYTARRDDHVVTYQVHSGFVRIICYSPTNKIISSAGNLVDIYVVPSPYLKPGEVKITLRDVSFSRTDATGHTTEEMVLGGITAANESNLTLKVSSSNKYSTAVLPFDVETIPAGLQVYSCNSIDGENLVLNRQQRIAAYTPYILYAPNGFDGTLSGSVDESKYSEVVADGYLRGAVAAQEIEGGNGCYVMQNKGDGPMFYKVDDELFSIPAGKCWLSLPAELQGSVSFRLDGTTGVEKVESRNEKVEIFDLTGRKVYNPAKGIYIIDGNKVLVK